MPPFKRISIAHSQHVKVEQDREDGFTRKDNVQVAGYRDKNYRHKSDEMEIKIYTVDFLHLIEDVKKDHPEHGEDNECVQETHISGSCIKPEIIGRGIPDIIPECRGPDIPEQ